MKITLSLTKFGILGMVTCLLFPASSVYGHGLGIDTISSIDIQGKEVSITLKCQCILKMIKSRSQLV